MPFEFFRFVTRHRSFTRHRTEKDHKMTYEICDKDQNKHDQNKYSNDDDQNNDKNND